MKLGGFALSKEGIGYGDTTQSACCMPDYMAPEVSY